MSRVYFHTPTETVEVYGTERAHMGVLCSNVANAIFGLFSKEQKLALVPAGHYLRQVQYKPDGFDRSFETWLAVGDGNFADGSEAFAVKLNTVLAVGNDPLCLVARLHGQCELHTYVMPGHAEWLAGIIEEGLECGVFREGFPDRSSGWRDVIALLRRTETPVVTSYSTSGIFPNYGLAIEGGTWTPPLYKQRPEWLREDESDEDYDAWYELSREEQWQLAFKALTSQDAPPRLDPNNWPWCFGDGRTAFDYLRPTESVRQVGGVS